MFVIKRRQRQNTCGSSLFPKKILIKSSLTAGKVVFLSVSCEIFWKLCFSYWVLPLNSKFRKVKVLCSDKVLMIFWCWVLIAFPILSSFEPGEVSAEPLFLVLTFNTRVRLMVLGWAIHLWCTKWRLILDFFPTFLFRFVLYQALSAGCFFHHMYVYKEPEDHQNGFCILYYLGRIC